MSDAPEKLGANRLANAVESAWEQHVAELHDAYEALHTSRAELRAVVAERDALRAALEKIAAANSYTERASWLTGIARAVLAGEAAPPPGKTGEANLGAGTARSSEGEQAYCPECGRPGSVFPQAYDEECPIGAPCRRDEGSMCKCGHARDWHSHEGRGDCEHDGSCACTAFTTDDLRSSTKSASRGAPLSAQTEGATP